MKSMLPQAATTAIALPLSEGIGGITDITAFAVIFNAVIVYALGALFLKIFHVKNPIAKVWRLEHQDMPSALPSELKWGKSKRPWQALQWLSSAL